MNNNKKTVFSAFTKSRISSKAAAKRAAAPLRAGRSATFVSFPPES
ncbi:hypothetical protein [uncultured Cloacibacillus sp.]|nr:hypothetical protein [uncultured Cloacibacillus sp.]